jgi:hypothetical protein
MITNAQYRCAVCRARKSRCIALHAGACQRCVETGEECDLEALRASQSPAISSTASGNDQPMRKSPPRSAHQELEAVTSSSLESTQVQVLSRSIESNVAVTASGVVETVFETSPTGTQPESRVPKSSVPSEEPEGTEGAILIVEDLGRTREFRLYLRHVFKGQVLTSIQNILASVPMKAFFSAFKTFCTRAPETKYWIRWTGTPWYVNCASPNITL